MISQIVDMKENANKLEQYYKFEMGTLNEIMNDLKRSYESEIKTLEDETRVLDSIILEREQYYKHKLDECNNNLNGFLKYFGGKPK